MSRADFLRDVFIAQKKLTPQEIEKIQRPDNIMAIMRDNLPQPIYEEIAVEFCAV